MSRSLPAILVVVAGHNKSPFCHHRATRNRDGPKKSPAVWSHTAGLALIKKTDSQTYTGTEILAALTVVMIALATM